MLGTSCCTLDMCSFLPAARMLAAVGKASQKLTNSGFRPELGRDLTKLRETVWNEVSRLRSSSFIVCSVTTDSDRKADLARSRGSRTRKRRAT